MPPPMSHMRMLRLWKGRGPATVTQEVCWQSRNYTLASLTSKILKSSWKCEGETLSSCYTASNHIIHVWDFFLGLKEASWGFALQVLLPPKVIHTWACGRVEGCPKMEEFTGAPSLPAHHPLPSFSSPQKSLNIIGSFILLYKLKIGFLRQRPMIFGGGGGCS